MRSRIATGATIVALLAGTGGAIAIGEAGSGMSGQGGAATAQYKPGKGCGKGHAPRHKKCPTHKPHKKHKTHKHTAKPKKHQPRSTNCKIRVIGQTLIAFCP